MVFGNVDFNGYKNISVGVEFEDDVFGKQIVLHLPKGQDTSNWYHGVRICTDLVSAPVLEERKEG